MKNLFLTTIIILASFIANSQINMSDSTSQIIGYWSKNDKQTYAITQQKYKVVKGDTVKEYVINYDVDITIIDSTAKNYIVEWHYKKHEMISENSLVKKLTKLGDNIKVSVQTDEFGALQEIVNWDEIQKSMAKPIKKTKKILKKELKNTPGFKQIMDQSFAVFNDKTAFFANALNEMHQFYTYHGGLYSFNEPVNTTMQFVNNYGGEPFDAEVTLRLDEIDAENDYSILRMVQTINKEQLTKATYNYLKKMGTLGDNLPALEVFPDITNVIYTSSKIHGTSGWVLGSLYTKEITTDGVLNVEETRIEIK